MFARHLIRQTSRIATKTYPNILTIGSRNFGLKLTSVQAKPTDTHVHDGNCCGGAPAEAKAEPEKVVCDPYEQGGKPYDLKTVKREMLGLDEGWTYDEDKKILSKSFKFHKRFTPTDAPAVPRKLLPGEPDGPTYGPGACFTFAQYITNLCTNCDHWVYDVTITPRKAEVTVQLKTIVRGGLTSNDFYLAMHLDALKKNRFSEQ